MHKMAKYLSEPMTVLRHGEQARHIRQALKTYPEDAYIVEMGKQYHAIGRAATLAEGVVLAGACLVEYRSNEAGERVPQRARAALDAESALKSRQRRAAEEMFGTNNKGQAPGARNGNTPNQA